MLKLLLSLCTLQEEPTMRCMVCDQEMKERNPDGSFPAACFGLCTDILFEESEELPEEAE